MKSRRTSSGSRALTAAADRALRRASRRAQETARRYGTPLWVIADGRLVAIQPAPRPTRHRP